MSSLIADLADSRSCGKPNLRLAAMWVVAVGISILLMAAGGAGRCPDTDDPVFVHPDQRAVDLTMSGLLLMGWRIPAVPTISAIFSGSY